MMLAEEYKNRAFLLKKKYSEVREEALLSESPKRLFEMISWEAKSSVYEDLYKWALRFHNEPDIVTSEIQEDLTRTSSHFEALQEAMLGQTRLEPLDQIGWVAYKARLEILEENLKLFKRCLI